MRMESRGQEVNQEASVQRVHGLQLSVETPTVARGSTVRKLNRSTPTWTHRLAWL